MSDQAELNSLVVDHLADLEAAARQIDGVITPMVEEAILEQVAAFTAEQDWAGESDDIAALWLGPKLWHDPSGDADSYLLFFKLRVVIPRGAPKDRHWLSQLTGAGAGKVGLYLTSDPITEVPLGKMVAADAELVQQLQARGFVYDVADRHALSLPITIDRQQLVAALRDDDLDAAMEPLARALAAAMAAVTLFEPLVARIAAMKAG